MQLDDFIKQNRSDMLSILYQVVEGYKECLTSQPEEYTEYGCDDPSIDVRLCIDLTDRYGITTPTWTIRTGLSDYDQYNSEYCAGLSIGLDTDANELLDDLINQLFNSF